jgi:hypothetical protein
VAPRKPTILVVTEDSAPSQAISAWLREAGLRVIGGLGPQPPSYLCAGGRGESCPFAGGGDVVVLDLWLASDTMLPGTPARQRLCHYLDLGKPVVALQRLGGLLALRRRRGGAGAVAALPACAPGGRIPPTPRVASARQAPIGEVIEESP